MLEYSREGLRIGSDRTTEKWQKVRYDRKGRKRVAGEGWGEKSMFVKKRKVCEKEKEKHLEIALFPIPEKGLLLG